MVKYCESTCHTKRRTTREILIGNVGVGGNNPVRIQSMTTSNTRDVLATVEQIKRLSDAGCELVRVTVQGMKEAEACEAIKNNLIQSGYNIPLIADIHFFPPAAMRVLDFVEKVRINPGNYVDKRASFKTIEYNDTSYAQEIEKIEEKFAPLVEKCKRLKKAMRIGTNHGSLSDRIMNRYGDTPKGMIKSALEFARICRKYDYHNFLFSMKSSNPQVMIQAYRLLVAEMMALGWDYPLHLGVTEAGQGEDGRIKSAMGIGSLLLDGIGDTLRVSLTEDAWNEIDPCKRLISFSKSYEGMDKIFFEEKHRHIESLQRRPVNFSKKISLHRDGTVIVSPSLEEILAFNFYQKLGCDTELSQPKIKISSSDCILLQDTINDSKSLKVINSLQTIGITPFSLNGENPNLIHIAPLEKALKTSQAVIVRDELPSQWSCLENIHPDVIFLSPSANRLHYARQFFDWLQTKNIAIPVILAFHYETSKEDLIIQAAAECGSLLCDGLGEGLCIQAPHDIDFLRNLSFNILQAARMRSSKTDFISCPSCGRTLFDLQEVSKRIREKTSHLPGVKIAIMGCIVNGPGEMADADFGYVGSKPGMIDLYLGKQCVEKDISFDEADNRLIELIKKHGRWIEPELTDSKQTT